jgi:hypothetical protein
VSLEGRICVVVSCQGDRVAEVALESSRPQLAHRVMAGRTPAEAAELAGLLFSLCGHAQRAAAKLACAAASDDGQAEPHADRAILAEWAREHAWRLLLDWPEASGQAPHAAGLQALHRAGGHAETLAQALDGLLAEHLLGETGDQWLTRDWEAFLAWLAAGRGAAALFDTVADDSAPGEAAWLPAPSTMTAEDVAGLARRALAEPLFCAHPVWDGRTVETGALARTRSRPLVAAWLIRRGPGADARLLARLVELAELPTRLRTGDATVLRAWTLADGTGVAGVETSRGWLAHIARLDGGRVADYRIISPTEWNFHPAGTLATALRRLPADARLEDRVRRLALAFDPCVDYGIEIRASECDHA